MSDKRIVDLVLALKHPEKVSEIQEALEPFTRHLGELDLSQIESARRTQTRAWLETYDLAVLDAIGMTVDDLIDARDTKRAQRKQGQIGNSDELLLVIARAFMDIERENGEFSEAVKKAVDDCSMLDPPHDLKPATARRYLNTLIRYGAIDMRPPKRGRPRSK